MFTRCPACQTVFRLHPEQLKQRNGEVRCGHCFHPFNALTCLVDEPAQATRPPVPPFQAPPPHSTHKPAGIPTWSPQPTRPLQTQPPVTPQPTRSPLEIDSINIDLSLYPTSESPTPEHKTAASTLPPFPQLLETDADPSLPPPTITPPPETPPVTPPPPIDTVKTVTPPPASPAPVILPTTPPIQEDDTPDLHSSEIERLDEIYGPAAPAPLWKRTLVGLAAGLLAGILAIQTLYIFRNEIARALPGLRPLLSQACGHLGCTLPLPRQAGLLSIENSDLQSDPGKPGRYILYATVRNQAGYLQDWPHLELTLTDAHDAPLSRRAFSPDLWVPAEKLTAGFAPRSDTAVRLVFDAAEITPSGYRLYVFYP